jgi:biopolymer transport protein ExbD
MRFARHAKIFRGPLDPAPVAAVLLLLMLFMLLGSLVYTPGALVQLGQTILVTSSNDIAFAGKTYKPGELDQLRADLQAAPGSAGFSVTAQPGADPAVAGQISNLFRITLPNGKNLTGTDNERVVVEVNFRGQCFYENQLVQDWELKAKLAARLKTAARNSKKLTLILWMDKAAEIQVLTRLEGLASDVGITEVLRAEQPPVLGGPP